MKNRNSICTKLLSLLLVMVMVLGVVPAVTPAAEASEITEAGAIKIDFIEFAQAIAANETIWGNLRDTDVGGIKAFGAPYNTDLTAAETDAYPAIKEYLDAEGVWNFIDGEGNDVYGNRLNGKRVFLNTTDDDYGLRFYPTIVDSHTENSERSTLMLTVNAPAAGLYHMDLSVLNEAVSSSVADVDGTCGRGHANIYVNEQLVYADYAFKAYTDTVADVSFGAVQLKKGENTVYIYVNADHFGTGTGSSSGRRAFNLRSLSFIPLGGVQVEQGRTMELDLRTTYLPFDAVVTAESHTVEVDDPYVAKAEFEADGDLLITGYGKGETVLRVSDSTGDLWPITVTVAEPSKPDNGTDYYIGGFKAATYTYDANEENTAEGSISYYDNGTALNEDDIYLDGGAVYYKSNDTSVVTVDQNGDITCVGEGSTTVVAYVLMDGTVTSDKVLVTVADETDLASIEAYANVDYVGEGSTLQLYARGFKSSGIKADMSQYPVAWEVDKETVATVSESGLLTGVAEGTVTVTATVGVDGVAVSDEIVIEVVTSQALEDNTVVFDFTYGRALDMQSATIEEDGIEIDWANTFNGGMDINYGDTSGIDIYMGQAGEKLALDFAIERDGWYQVELRGKSISYAGVLAHAVIDDAYVGDIDFADPAGSTYGAGGFRNTVYLEAGKHDFDLIAKNYGRYWLGKIILHSVENPGDPRISFTGEQTLVAGQTAELALNLTDYNGHAFYLQQVSEVPAYTNYYTLSSSDESVITVSGMTVTAVGTGTANVVLTGEMQDVTVNETLAVTVQSGSINYVELSAEATTLKPNADPVQLELAAYDAAGEVMTMPEGTVISYASEDTGIASVSDSGLVTITGPEGSVKITATVTEGDNVQEAEIWISVTAGKTEPTIYTYEERANAQANAKKYTWAATEKNNAVKNADIYVEHLDQIYKQWAYEGIPRATQVGYKNELGYRYCRYCGVDLVAKYGNYPYIVDPINNPWKITCPECDREFPSNDFGAYYESGVGADGRFNKENADATLLTNDLYPEMGEGWGVDDGFGYVTGEYDANGREVVHTYIAYYMTCQMYGLGDYDKHSLTDIFQNLIKAYIYTGDEKYGSAGAILVDRLADIYPTYDIADWSTGKMAFSDGGSQRGKIIGPIWDAILSQTMAKAVDAFWPCAGNAAVIAYLQQDYILEQKGMTAEEITPEYLRTHAEDNILLEIFKCAKTDYYNGNFGMEEAGVAYAAVALDRLPETQQMFEWVFHEEQNGGLGKNGWNTGGDVSRVLTEDVCRDGFGYEVSYLYNSLWTQHLMELADALSGYEGAAEYDLWNNPKFVNMYTAFARLTVCGHLTPQVGEAGFVQSTHNQLNVDRMLTAYLNVRDKEIKDDLVVDLARALYAGNGNSVSGLHGTIFMEDPVDGVQSSIINTVAEAGPWDFSDSDMMSGFGIAILREGPEQYLGKTENADEFFDYWMYFGSSNTAHGRLEALAIDMEAFGLGVSSSMGYPAVVSSTSPERMQWVRNTVSHNTVVVDDRGQTPMDEGGFPKHFEDAGQVKIMDAEANHAYPETDIYRRTVVTVAAENGVHYAVDFFRILGGSEHVYSFHGATTLEPVTAGLTMVNQPMGTYAGPDVPFGDWVTNPDSADASTNAGSGYSWLKEVSRDDSPETYFSIDWEIEDFHNQLTTSDGIHLKLHMLSEEPLTEVALADGVPPQTGRNPDHLEYALIRRSGNPGMDTLFTAIIEPYQDDELIASAELLDVELASGVEGVNDRAAAMKVTLVSGRQDYIIYATNPNCTYTVTDGTTRTLTFCGFAGVVSYNKSGNRTYAWGSELTSIYDGETAIISDAQPRVTGTVTDFTKGLKWDHEVTVTMDTPVTAEELTGRYLYVNNDGSENAAYRIHGAKVSGNTAVLNLNNQTLIREFVDASNEDLGYVYNIAEGNTYSIPLSSSVSCAHSRNSTSYTSNGDGTHMVVKTCLTCGVVTGTRVANCSDSNADGACDRCSGGMPVQIATAEELIAFAEQVNSSTAAINAVLTADIDLTGYEWTPIGSTSNPFKGVFSGKGYTVSGMSVAYAGTESSEDYRLGLFGNALNAQVKDVTVEGEIVLSGTASTKSRIGGLIGCASGTTVQNCISKVDISGTNDSNITGFYNIGGLIGEAQATKVVQCGNEGDLTAVGYNVGGLVGYVVKAAEPTLISECYNHGDVYGYANVGGLVGNLFACGTNGKNNTVTDCYSSGDFGSYNASGVEQNAAGGLIGKASDSSQYRAVKNCYVSGTTGKDADGAYTNKAIVCSPYGYNVINQWQNLYYLESAGIAETYDIMMAKSHKEMLTQEFVDSLGGSFKLVENRYPVLTWECGHPGSTEIYYDNGDGSHLVVFACAYCGKEERYTEVCEDLNGDNYCDSCGGMLLVVDEITFAGSNMTLGNELHLNFLILKSSLDLSQSYTAVVEKFDYDGVTVVDTVEVSSSEWDLIMGQYYRISYGVVAKQMGEKMRVTVYNADGKAVGEPYEDSVRSYAMRALASSTADQRVKTMVVDMLNYGAAAQMYFEYNTADLANKLLTEDQLAMATQTVECENRQTKITNFDGVNLTLLDSIEVNFFFPNMPKDVTGMYGTISFTNHMGDDIHVDVKAEDLVRTDSTNRTNLCYVTVDELVLADYRTLVSVTVYHADGTVFGAGVDSIESYAKRAMNHIGDLTLPIMRFAESAYNYLHNR